MVKSSTSLRLYGIKNCPTLLMSATVTESEVDQAVASLGIRASPVVLTSTPIQSHIKFSVVRRPANNFGIDGHIDASGVRRPGLMDLLMRLYLKDYLLDLELGRSPKKCIIFFRGTNMLAEVYKRLMDLTNYKYKDCRDSPFVMNHSSLLPTTVQVIANRSSEISLYLASNKMLLGIDIPNIDVIIFVRPFDQVAALVQGGGRGGRKMDNGMRRKVQVYQLYNYQDIGNQNKFMSGMMRTVCRAKECTRRLLKNYFVGSDESPTELSVNVSSDCCHNCDKMLNLVV